MYSSQNTQRRGTKRTGRIFASVADLGIFRGGQGRTGVRRYVRRDLAGISGAVYSQPGRRSGRIRSDCPVSRLLGIEKRPEKGMVVEVEGADLMDGTPILDIKPYLPYVDCMPDARGGFADRVKGLCAGG